MCIVYVTCIVIVGYVKSSRYCDIFKISLHFSFESNENKKNKKCIKI